ncbi:recombinase family protein [Lactiplantibacillus paraplantarum]|uniref:recombinase family protein n=1 Tax=Lactiplantibacillus paraplantarum TaxID=60520 RepID=UPI0023AA878B|nr:recombinase family protein [Lactiplantibacillus paraplantarum]WEE37499.1 recombinase family protein [Lactiplantibacillus paraplantarum]
MNDYAASKNVKVTIFEDAGISGSTTRRPQLQTMLNFVKLDSDVKYLIVTRLDRLTRNAQDMMDIAETCLQHDIQVISLNESLSSKPTDLRMQMSIYGAVAEFQRSIIRENVMLGSAKRAQAGLPLSMVLPTGY